MTDIDILRFRSVIFQKIRTFLTENGFIELDTPSLSPIPISAANHEPFRTVFTDPWTDEEKTVYLVPSHEYFIKKIVSATQADFFQMSKCFVNGETADRLHSPEFTLLELYKHDASYDDTVSQVMNLITSLLPVSAENGPIAFFQAPHISLSIEEAFMKYAGIQLSECRTAEQFAIKIRQHGIPEFPDNPFDEWPEEELFSLLLSQCIEPALPEDRCVFLTGCQPFMPETWRLYAAGIDIAQSHNEKVELEIDRLIMLLTGKKSIESVIPFPFRLKTGYY